MKLTTLPCIFISTLILTNCNSDDSDSTPRISSTTPADGAIDVEPTVNPIVTFNEDMFAVSITETEFTLSQSDSDVAATVTFDALSNTATLTPTTSLALLSPYTASLTEAITDLAGNPLNASSWSFTTRDGQWQTPTLIEIDNTGDAYRPQIAITTDGYALAVWVQSDGTRNNIWANRFIEASGWGDAELIETDNAGSSYVPQIAFDGNGNALAVWYQNDGALNRIWANRFTPSSGWGTAELIETDNTAGAANPQIAVDRSGNALAVWYQWDDTRPNIWANRFTATGGWGSAELIETDNTGRAYNPQVAFDTSGNALAVWRQSDGTHYNIWANRFTATAGWGSAELIETVNAGGASDPQIAIDSAGNALAVWHQDDDTQYNIWANRFNTTSGWGSAELIETGDAGTATDPKVAFDIDGNALAIWRQSDGTRFTIWSNRFTEADGWGTAELLETVETDNSGNPFEPQIAIDNTGNAIAVWYQHDGAQFNIWANRFSSASGWGSAELIETNDASGAHDPQVAIDGSGNALAVWHQSDGTRSNIWVNRFE